MKNPLIKRGKTLAQSKVRLPIAPPSIPFFNTRGCRRAQEKNILRKELIQYGGEDVA